MIRSVYRLVACSMLSCLLFHACCTARTQPWRKRLPSSALCVEFNPLNPNSIYAEGDSGNLYASYDRGGTWHLAGSTGILDGVRQILIHPSDTTVWFCAGEDLSGALLKSTDAGASWRPVLTHFGLDGEGVGLDALHPDTMFAGNFFGGTVYRSTDRGETWTLAGDVGMSLCALTVRPDSANIIYAGTDTKGRISKSTDAGATWRIVRSGGTGEIPKIVVSPTAPLIAYATVYSDQDTVTGVLKTTDGGESWVKTSLTEIEVWALAVDGSDPDVVYAGTFTGGAVIVFKSSDGGLSWASIGDGLPNAGAIWNLKLHPLNSHYVLASVTSGLFDFGGIYGLRAGASVASIGGAVLDSVTRDTIRTGRLVVPSTGDAVDLRVTGGRYSFEYFDGDPYPTPDVHVEAYPFYTRDVPLGYVLDSTIAEDLALQKLPLTSVTGTITDSTELPLRGEATVTVSVTYGSVALHAVIDSSGRFDVENIALPYAPLISTYAFEADPDLPFRQVRIDSLAITPGGVILSLRSQPADIFLVGEDSAQFHTYFEVALESLGVHPYVWNTVSRGPAPFQEGTLFKKKSVVYYTGTKHTPLTPGELDSLTSCLDAGCNLFITGQDFVEKNDSSALLRDYLGVRFAGNSGFILSSGVSGDLFSGFSFLTLGTPQTSANDQVSRDSLRVTNPRAKVAMTYGGIGIAAVRLDSAGAGGKAVVMGFGFEAINSAATRKNVMQKIIGYFDGSIVLGVGEESGGLPPRAFKLEQNYPDPFNPTTVIVFELPRESRVKLTVYDLLGREIRILEEGTRPAGRSEILFNAAGLPSGVYCYRLQAVPLAGAPLLTPSFSGVKKMVLLK